MQEREERGKFWGPRFPLAVVGPSLERLGSHVVETSARALIEVLHGIPRKRHVCAEEGVLSCERSTGAGDASDAPKEGKEPCGWGFRGARDHYSRSRAVCKK